MGKEGWGGGFSKKREGSENGGTTSNQWGEAYKASYVPLTGEARGEVCISPAKKFERGKVGRERVLGEVGEDSIHKQTKKKSKVLK